MASRLVVEAETDPALRVYIPALSLAAAERERAGVAEHLGALPSVNIEGLDFSEPTFCTSHCPPSSGRAVARS